MSGTVKTDAAAFTATANAKAVLNAKGTDIGVLMNLLQAHAVDMQALIRQIVALHPSGGGDASTLTALNAILAELA